MAGAEGSEPDYSAAGTTDGLETLRPGTTVSVYLQCSAPTAVGVRFFVFDSDSRTVWATDEEIRLAPTGGWTPVRWTVPDVDRVEDLGLQVTPVKGSPVTIAIDDLTWRGSGPAKSASRVDHELPALIMSVACRS